MKIVISPAKSLNFEAHRPKEVKPTQPRFLNKTKEINAELKKISVEGLSKLMKISAELAKLNVARNQAFHLPFNQENAYIAAFFYNGDTYKGLAMHTLSPNHWDTLQNQVRIISGLYGLLRPFDLIQPYRLEMKIKLSVGSSRNLYDYWQKQLTESLNQELQPGELLVNCASKEYADVIDYKRLKNPVISPIFKDFKNGELKIISFLAKKARGAMARFLVENEIEDLAGLKDFHFDGYGFSNQYTQDESHPMFVR